MGGKDRSGDAPPPSTFAGQIIVVGRFFLPSRPKPDAHHGQERGEEDGDVQEEVTVESGNEDPPQADDSSSGVDDSSSGAENSPDPEEINEEEEPEL